MNQAAARRRGIEARLFLEFNALSLKSGVPSGDQERAAAATEIEQPSIRLQESDDRMQLTLAAFLRGFLVEFAMIFEVAIDPCEIVLRGKWIDETGAAALASNIIEATAAPDRAERKDNAACGAAAKETVRSGRRHSRRLDDIAAR